MSPGSSTESYPVFAHIGLRENPGKNLNQVTCPNRESNPGHLVSRPDALTVTPQSCDVRQGGGHIGITIPQGFIPQERFDTLKGPLNGACAAWSPRRYELGGGEGRGSHIGSLSSKETLRGHSDSSFRGEGYIQCCVGVRLCDMYSNQELAEIHFMYGKADGNAALARRLYQERYPQRQCPDRKTFVRLHYRLCEYGKFNSPGLGRGRPRSTTPEVQEEILEAVNMTLLSAHEG
ncbi:hypothetical protein ANN_08037 [Periplaneta americana]|uniref:DUF4817 domain-containing protein n=1 Tax=Periplaneta americana TaxID=6978 RepID=A0ABQ8T1W3_PERAM|nr:hypothetical protein ANN_08037 [Periplaneta americana]